VFPFHAEHSASVAAAPQAVFARLDEHALLSEHMTRSSVMMAGSRMQVVLDERRGKEVGSRITLEGAVLGLPLAVEEVVTERAPPWRKAWETVGTPRLLVIGPYRMGFEVTPEGPAQSRLRALIDYALPTGALARWLGRTLGGAYARWCTQRMVRDAVAHLGTGAHARIA
jgi:hypothetical protein